MQHHSEVLLCFFQLHSDAQPGMGERDVKFLLAKDTMEMMLKSMYSIRDELSEPVSAIAFFSRFIFMSNVLSSLKPVFSCQDETP